jgi:hypothetical protein
VEVVPEDQRDLDAPGALHAHCLQVTLEPNNVGWGRGHCGMRALGSVA